MSRGQRPDGPRWGLREGGRSSAGAGRLDPREGGEEGDEVTLLGSCPRPSAALGRGGLPTRPTRAAPASPNPGGPPSQLAALPSGFRPAARGPVGRPCVQESGQGRQEPTLACDPRVAKDRFLPGPAGALVGGFESRAPAMEARRCREAAHPSGPERAEMPEVTQRGAELPGLPAPRRPAPSPALPEAPQIRVKARRPGFGPRPAANQRLSFREPVPNG